MEHEPIATRARRYHVTALDTDRDSVTRTADLVAVRERALELLRPEDHQTADDRATAWCLAELATALLDAGRGEVRDFVEIVAMRYRADDRGAPWQYLDISDPAIRAIAPGAERELLFR